MPDFKLKNQLVLPLNSLLTRRIIGIFLTSQVLSLLITLPIASSSKLPESTIAPIIADSSQAQETSEIKKPQVANLKQVKSLNALSNKIVICTSKKDGSRAMFQRGKCQTKFFERTTWYAKHLIAEEPLGAKRFTIQVCTNKTSKALAVKNTCKSKTETAATYHRWQGPPAKTPPVKITHDRLGSAALEVTPPTIDGGSEISSYRITASPGDLKLVVQPNNLKFNILSGLTPGVSYSIGVEAINIYGASVVSKVDYLAPKPPSTPKIREVSSAGENAARIFFEPPASDGGAAITRYSVSVIARGNEVMPLNSGVISPGVLEVNDLPNATTLAFFISAHNAVGGSLPSDISFLINGPLKVINVPAIGGLIAPATGALPVTSVNGGNGYSGTSSWSGSPTTFAAATVYIATINLTPSTGFTLSGVPANFFTVSGASLVTNSASSGVVTAVFPATALGAGLVPTFGAPTPTSSGFTVQITNYDAAYTWTGTASASGAVSISGSGLVTVIGVAANTSSVVTITTIRSGFANGAATVSATSTIAAPAFTLSTSSEVRAVNTAATGFSVNSTGGAITSFAISPSVPAGISLNTLTGAFSGTPSVVASATAYTITATNAAGSTSQTFTFTVSAAVISVPAIGGVTAPVTGATPVTTVTAANGYTGTITWSGSPTTFASATTYTATITLTANSGFTFTGVSANFFTVAGSTSVTNPINSGVITAVFPANATTISLAAIGGVTAPVTGVTPVTVVTETAQYTGAVTWSTSPVTFSSGTIYTATITLTPKTGYTLTGIGANFFTVVGATSVTNPINSGVITAVFAATAPTARTFDSLTANGASGETSTTLLTLTFDTAVTGLAAGDITVTGATKGALTFISGGTYTLAISAITVANGETITVAVAKSGFSFTPSSRNVVVNVAPVQVPAQAITGIIAPVQGVQSVTSVNAGTGFTATLVWEEKSGATWTLFTSVFANPNGSKYRAKITLTPTSGYTLNGVASNAFTVTGATAVYATGVVTATF